MSSRVNLKVFLCDLQEILKYNTTAILEYDKENLILRFEILSTDTSSAIIYTIPQYSHSNTQPLNKLEQSIDGAVYFSLDIKEWYEEINKIYQSMFVNSDFDNFTFIEFDVDVNHHMLISRIHYKENMFLNLEYIVQPTPPSEVLWFHSMKEPRGIICGSAEHIYEQLNIVFKEHISNCQLFITKEGELTCTAFDLKHHELFTIQYKNMNTRKMGHSIQIDLKKIQHLLCYAKTQSSDQIEIYFNNFRPLEFYFRNNFVMYLAPYSIESCNVESHPTESHHMESHHTESHTTEQKSDEEPFINSPKEENISVSDHPSHCEQPEQNSTKLPLNPTLATHSSETPTIQPILPIKKQQRKKKSSSEIKMVEEDKPKRIYKRKKISKEQEIKEILGPLSCQENLHMSGCYSDVNMS
jgi:hypothetical protein